GTAPASSPTLPAVSCSSSTRCRAPRRWSRRPARCWARAQERSRTSPGRSGCLAATSAIGRPPPRRSRPPPTDSGARRPTGSTASPWRSGAGAHGERCLAVAQRVMLELEGGAPEAAEALCLPLVEVAARMTEGSERAMAAALAALARRARALPAATPALERAIAELRDVDAKARLAYVLNSAAAQDLAA